MKTDAIFYEIFKELPSIFFEFIGKPDTNTNTYEFTAPEIKQRAFRDELGEEAEESLGVGIVRLIVESENKAGNLAKQLIDKAREELTDAPSQRAVF